MRQLATITVIGRDKTGVVARVTSRLFEQGANIEELEEQVTRGQFSMTIQASWRIAAFHLVALQSSLSELGRVLGMEIKLRLTHPGRQRFAIMVTKEPHCLTALLGACRSGQLKAEPAIVLSNRGDLAKLALASGIPFVRVRWQERARAEARALKALEKRPQAYRQAYEQGVKIVGVTAHFVTMHLDEGPIIAQGAFPVRANATLKDIVTAGQKLEAKVLVQAVRRYLTKRLDVYWGIVKEV